MDRLSSIFNLKKNSHNSLLFNSVLWFISFFILLLFLSGGKPIKIDYYYTFGFIASLFFPVVISFYFLIPKFLKTEKYIVFAFLFLVNFIVFGTLNVLFLNDLINYILPNFYFISYLNTYDVYLLFFIFISITSLIKLAEDWVYFNKIENETLKIENKQIETQLSSLKAQINPHFLFNSLNVIYSLVLQDHKKTTNAIVQLSDILRYVLYDSDTQKNALSEEIKLLNNYLDFQKFRYNHKANVTLKTTVDDESFSIYPMLLLPLVENSFKHGIKGDIDQTFIRININKTKNEFHFFIENNLAKEDNTTTEKYSGLGLKNIQQNLELIYPKKHQFVIKKQKDTFSVSLKIYINEN